jgi:hypothetical protein
VVIHSDENPELSNIGNRGYGSIHNRASRLSSRTRVRGRFDASALYKMITLARGHLMRNLIEHFRIYPTDLRIFFIEFRRSCL